MRRTAVLLALVSTLAPACKGADNTKIVVAVWSDLAVQADLDSVRIEVAGTGSKTLPITAASPFGQATLVAKLELVPLGAKNETFTVTATGLRSGNEVVAQTASVSFVAGQSLLLKLFLAGTCKKMKCSGNYTCAAGACDQPIAVSKLPAYDPSAPLSPPDAGVGGNGGTGGSSGMSASGGTSGGVGGTIGSGGVAATGGIVGTGGNGANGAIAGGTIASGTIAGGGRDGGGDAGTPDAPGTQPDVPVGGTGGGGMSTGAGGTGGGGESTSGPGPDCPALAGFTNGSVSVPTRTPSSTATYSCETGYKLSGAATRTCQSDGTWSGTTPTCASVNCDAPPSTANGSVIAPLTTYGSTATYSCAVGYNLSGTATRTCQTDGTWSGTVPTCGLVDCHAPPGTASGSVSAPLTTYGSTATYSCAVGYNLSGTATRTCLANGTWGGTTPTCVLADCGPLSSPTHGSVSTPTTTFGSVATYSCDTGYAITGVTTRSCQANETWSDAAPTCSIQMLTVTINKIGAGTGTVTSTPAGISCGSTCQATYAYGTAITLSAAPDANQRFMGWDSTACTGMGTCAFAPTSNTVVRASFSPPPNIVFTTSTTQTAALGGLAGADAICAQRALAAGLAGTYRAWLSTSTVNAIDRLGSASGWVRPDGKPVLNNVADIAQDKLFYPPRLDEFGNDLGADPVVMTATGRDGRLTVFTDSTTCGDFTSEVENGLLVGGWASANSELFNNVVGFSCGNEARIYCFGIDRTAQVAVTPAAGRRAFMTTAYWTPGGGIGSADTLCQKEATAANLPGTYKALLAPSGASAASRLNGSGAPWVRSDGIPLAPTARDFFSTTVLDVSPDVTADGFVYCGSYGVWSGAATMTTAGSDATNCSNWLSTSGTGAFGRAGDSAVATFFDGGPIPCNYQGGVLTCLQE